MKDWEKQFDETISNVMGITQVDSLRIKQFITDLLAEQRKEIEGLKKPTVWTVENEEFSSRHQDHVDAYYNQAIDDVLEKLQKE